jgi:hypothetical protein
MKIGLQDIGTVLKARGKGGEGIFGMGPRAAAMADDPGTGTSSIKKRMRHPLRLSCRGMSVLTRNGIFGELDQGRVRIDPFDPSQVGAASIDLTLGGEIRQILNDPGQ